MAAKKGRPKGSKNKKVEETVEREEFSCNRCGSTERSAYKGRPRVKHGTFTGSSGRLYTKVTMRNCQCLKCGLWRWDIRLMDPAIQPKVDNVLSEINSEQNTESNENITGKGTELC